MPTMSRPALDVKGGTSPMKEVTFAILQTETLEPERTGPGPGPCGRPSWLGYLVSFSRLETAGLSWERMKIAST